MVFRKSTKQLAFLGVALASVQLAAAQTPAVRPGHVAPKPKPAVQPEAVPTPIAAKKGSLIGSTCQGSAEPASLLDWKHTEGMATPRNKPRTAFGVDHYEKGPQHMFVLLQKIPSPPGVKEPTWQVLDTLYIGHLERGTFVEFCTTCKNAGKPSTDVFVTINNNPTKDDSKRGYYSLAQLWVADRIKGKFVVPTESGIKSYIEKIK